MPNLVGHVRSVHFGVPDLARSLDFYSNTSGLSLVGSEHGVHYLRGSGSEHHVLRLSMAAHPTLLGIDFAAGDRNELERFAVDALADGLCERGCEVRPAAAGGGVGITLLSPDGIPISISADVARHNDTLPETDVPTQLTHVVINSANAEQQLAFFIGKLGFTLSDSTARQFFLRSGSDHHSLAVAVGQNASLHHAAFETRNFDAQMYASGRLVEQGYPVEWGPGRHGPGANIFCYFIDPDGFAVEYTCEVQQIEEAGYEPQDDGFWANLPRRPCRWGIAGRPSKRMASAFSGMER